MNPIAYAATIVVDTNDTADYTHIQEAINTAKSGDIISVKNGVYYEHLIINQDNLTLIGENKTNTIIDGSRTGGILSLYSVNNSTIQGFAIKNGKKPLICPSLPKPTGYTQEFLKENYSMELLGFDTYGNRAWISLTKNGTEVDDFLLGVGDIYKYETSIEFKLDTIFLGMANNLIKICNITQYSRKDHSLIIKNESALLLEGSSGEFIPDCGGIVWELEEGYTLNVIDIRIINNQQKAFLLLTKDENLIDYTIINTGENYTYYRDGNLILSANLEGVFYGQVGAILVKLSHVDQYSEVNMAQLISDTGHMYITGYTREIEWTLEQNYSLSAMDININKYPTQIWLRLKKDGITIEDQFADLGENLTFHHNGSTILNLKVGIILYGRKTDLSLISNIYQYSENNEKDVLIQNISHLFVFELPKGKEWHLNENYSFVFMGVGSRTYSDPLVWIRMKKNGLTVDDRILKQHEVYQYYNNNMLLFNASINTIFGGKYYDMLKITNASQYSETDGTELYIDTNKCFYPSEIDNVEREYNKLTLHENYSIFSVDINYVNNNINNNNDDFFTFLSWFRLYKNTTLIDEIILHEGQNYSYYIADNEIIHMKFEQAHRGYNANIIKLTDINQHSEINNSLIMENGSVFLILDCNDAGILLTGSSFNDISNIDISDVKHGISLFSSSNNNIISNITILNNYNETIDKYTKSIKYILQTDTGKDNNSDSGGSGSSGGVRSGITGIEVFHSNNNTFVNNNIINNYLNMNVYNSSNNHIYHNNFINISYNVKCNNYSTNQWDKGWSVGGNYWSDYSGIDANNDSIGDTPYIINYYTGVMDRYPYIEMNGWKNTTGWKNEWIGEDSEGGSIVTTSELQEAIHYWLEDVPVRGHIMHTADLRKIIVVWLSE